MITLRFVLLGVCIWLATVMASGRTAYNPIARVLRALGAFLTVLGLLGLFVGIWSPGGLLLAVPLGAVLVFALINYWRRRHEAMQDSLLNLVTLAARRNIPLVPLAQAFAQDAPVWAQWPTRTFARRLDEGHSLLTATRAAFGLLPRQTTTAIQVGESLDALPECLDVYTRANRNDREIDGRVSNVLGYLLIVLLTIVATGLLQLFMAWRIMPEFIKILDDFALMPPAPTEAYVEVFDSTFMYYIPLVLCAALLTVAVAAAWICHLAASLGMVPFAIAGSFRKGSEIALVLQLLGLAVRRQRSVDTALAALADSHPLAHLRGRLRGASLDIRLGVDPWQSLAQRRILRSGDVDFLRSASQAGNLPWALDELARRRARRSNRLLLFGLRTFAVICFVVVAAQVVFYAIAGFAPIVSIIEAVA
ncbi:MAG: type II secretion system F family protein [Pirellulales bacterium]